MIMVKKMQDMIESMRPEIEAIHWNQDQCYAQWLSQAYYIARRSTSYLGLCLFHSEKYPYFQKRCAEHIAEETGHEKLIENDLKHLGLSLLPELPSTMTVYQPQYFRIVGENPLSFMGYVFLLELLAPAYGPYILDQVQNKKALSFMKVHASADEDHIETATEILSQMSENTKVMAMSNFIMSREAYRRMLAEIAQLQSSQSLQKSVFDLRRAS